MFNFSRQVITWRMSRSLSQSELAHISGLARPNLIDIEYGRRDITLRTIRKLSQALDLSPGQLLEETAPYQRDNPFDQFTRHDWEQAAHYLLEGECYLEKEIKSRLDYFKVLFAPFLAAQGIKQGRCKRGSSQYPYSTLKKIYEKKTITMLHQKIKKLIPQYRKV